MFVELYHSRWCTISNRCFQSHCICPTDVSSVHFDVVVRGLDQMVDDLGKYLEKDLKLGNKHVNPKTACP